MYTCHFILGGFFFFFLSLRTFCFHAVQISNPTFPASINSNAIRSTPLRLIFISLITWKSGARHALLISEGPPSFLLPDSRYEEFSALIFSRLLLSQCLPCIGALLSPACYAPSHPLAYRCFSVEFFFPPSVLTFKVSTNQRL